MSESVASLNTAVAWGALVLIALALVFLWMKAASPNTLSRLISRYAILGGFFLSLAASLAAFYYSEVVGFLPCGLCWLQRVALIPLPLFFGLALLRKEGRLIAPYALLLSVGGALIALYHHFIQVGGTEFIPCPAAGGDCGKLYIFELGFVTFPLISFAVFFLLATLTLFAMEKEPGFWSKVRSLWRR